MTNNNNVILETADKIAIAVAIAAFLTFSGMLLNESNKMHKKIAAQEQIQKTQQSLKAKTLDLSKQR